MNLLLTHPKGPTPEGVGYKGRGLTGYATVLCLKVIPLTTPAPFRLRQGTGGQAMVLMLCILYAHPDVYGDCFAVIRRFGTRHNGVKRPVINRKKQDGATSVSRHLFYAYFAAAAVVGVSYKS